MNEALISLRRNEGRKKILDIRCTFAERSTLTAVSMSQGPTMNYIFIKLVRMVLEPNSLLLPYQKDETRKVTIVKPL